MMEESGHIVRIEGEYAWVNTERRSSCSSCSVQKGCGSGTLANMFGRRTHQIRARNNIGAAVGEQVVLGLDESALIRGSVLVYMTPLLGLLGGGLLGQMLAPQLNLAGSELPSIIGALSGLGLSLLWLMARNRRWMREGSFQAEIIRHAKADTPSVPVHFLGN